MRHSLDPVPSGAVRRTMVEQIRDEATDIAKNHVPPVAQENSGETALDLALSTFTKGLVHDAYGLLQTAAHLDTFIKEIDQSSANPATSVPLPGTHTSRIRAEFAVPKHAGSYT